MQAIEEESEELLAVVLIAPFELGSETTDSISEGDRGEKAELLAPECLDELSNSVRQDALRAENVGFVDRFLVAAFLQESCNGNRSAETLNHRIHVARIAKVFQARQTDGTIAHGIQLFRKGTCSWARKVRCVLQELEGLA